MFSVRRTVTSSALIACSPEGRSTPAVVSFDSRLNCGFNKFAALTGTSLTSTYLHTVLKMERSLPFYEQHHTTSDCELKAEPCHLLTRLAHPLILSYAQLVLFFQFLDRKCDGTSSNRAKANGAVSLFIAEVSLASASVNPVFPPVKNLSCCRFDCS
jgi:hypothetical protein